MGHAGERSSGLYRGVTARLSLIFGIRAEIRAVSIGIRPGFQGRFL